MAKAARAHDVSPEAIERRQSALRIALQQRGLRNTRQREVLTELGLAHERQFSDGHLRYEAADDLHHDHLICTRCGLIVEFEEDEIERLQEEVALRHGFRLASHRMELYGVCRNCLSQS